MKLIFTLITLLMFTIATAGDVYKAPKIKFSSKTKGKVNIVQEKSNDSGYYHFQNSTGNKRSLASEKEEEKIKNSSSKKDGRNPASLGVMPENRGPVPYWKYENPDRND